MRSAAIVSDLIDTDGRHRTRLNRPELAGLQRPRPAYAQLLRVLALTAALVGPRVVSADTGGPDAAGYRFIDSNEAGGPAYDFEDISGTGTRIAGLDDDNVVGPFALGFTFNYYDTDYTQVYVSSNCFITVLAGQDDGCCSSEPIPDATNPNGIIAGWYEDVDPRVGDVYYETLGAAPNRRFILQWSAVKLYGFPDTITLEYKLFEGDNSIEVHYQQAVTAGEVYSVGIENQDGTVGLQYYRGSADLATPLVVKYFNNPGVLSIARADADPTNAATVDYVVTFTEDVAGVDVSDFGLTTTGLAGTSVLSVTPASASVYTVSVDTGTGDGTLRLDLEDDDSITSTTSGSPLGGAGNDNGDFSGETYTIDRTGPQVDAIDRLDTNPTDAAQVNFVVKFDEPVDGVDVADFSTSTTGSLAGTSVDSVSPAFGNALDLSSNPEVGGKHLNLGNDASLQLSALTLEAWVCYQKDGAETIVARGHGAGGGATDYIFQINKDGGGKLNLFAAGAWHNSTTAIAPNTWTYVAVTYDGVDKKFYLNGALDNTEPHAGAIVQTTKNAYIGRQGESTDAGHYDGLLDEVRVWNVVREETEIEATMNSTLMGDETGLVGYWRFEQFEDLGAGAAGVNDIEDCSINSNHGDAVNGPTLTTSNFSGLAPDYIVRVNTGTGSGELGLILEDDDSIMDEATNPFGGVGEQDYSGGQTYTIDRPGLPTVTTTAVSSITGTTADSGGNVTDDGGEAVTARGVCWSTVANPTTADDNTVDGAGTGVFTSNITGLDPDTTYHVRAYATNSVGTAYGDDLAFTTDAIPSVTTTAISNVTGTTADSGGNVTDDGGEAVTARGVCWSTSPNPTTADDKTVDGAGTGVFTSDITGLDPDSTYHVRAYATNSIGTTYGDDIVLTTAALQPDPELDPEPAPDLRVTIEAQAAGVGVLVGDDVSVTVAVENVGTATATAVIVVVPLPDNAEFVSARFTASGGAGAATVIGGNIMIEFGDVRVGHSPRVEVVLRVTAAGEMVLGASATSEELTTPTAADAAAIIEAEDEYLMVVQTTTPVYLCGPMGFAPLLLLFGLTGLKSRGRRRRRPSPGTLSLLGGRRQEPRQRRGNRASDLGGWR